VNLGDFQDRRGNLLRDAVRFNWWIIALFMVAGLILGSLFAYVRPPKYSSSETLILNQIVGNPYTPNSNSDTLEMLQTEAASVTSEDVLRKVVADTGVGLSTAAIRSRTKVSVPPNTQALQITYTSATRELAPVVVASMAQNFIDYRETLAEEAIQTRDTNIDDQLALQQEELKQLRIDHAGQQALASVRANIIALNQARAENDAQDTTGGRHLAEPLLPKAGKTKHFIVFAIAGMVVVGLFGLGFAVWRERRRDRIRASSDLDDYQFDAPVTAIHGRQLDDAALRHLRMRLAPQIREHGIVSIVSTTRGQGLATGVLLANSLSGGGTSVVLIDGTGTERNHRDALDKGREPGLAEALVSDTVKPAAIRISKNFGYLPAGQNAAAASEHLVEDRARTVIESIAERYDLTLVATMPLDNVEGEALARLTEGILLLVELDRTSHYDLGVAMRTISSQGHKLLGVFVLPARK
jgi:succinoglycan biosynthesis transport protein ExoP